MMQSVRNHLRAGLVLAALMFYTAHAENTTIQFTSTPVSGASSATATVGLKYLYQAVAAASNGDVVRYALRYGPAGMKVDAQSGLLQWTPRTAGTFPVGIRAELAGDPTVSAAQEWSVVVTSPPAVSISSLVQGGTTFCLGENITVSYTAAGTFVPGNAFILQLSNPSGGFDSEFRNLGSVSSTSSGTITVAIPKNVTPGSAYRVRVMASNPVTIGDDNGVDLRINALPVPRLKEAPDSTGEGDFRRIRFLQNMPITFHSITRDVVSLDWEFSGDANVTTYPGNDSVTVTYATGGTKEFTLTAKSLDGCSETRVYRLNVTATNPVIPATVKVVQGEESGEGAGSIRVWVCPGGVYHTGGGGSQFIYAETGASVVLDGGGSQTVYLKRGASVSQVGSGGGHVVIYETGAGLSDPNTWERYEVSSMIFDYTDAPVGGCPSLAPYTKRIPKDTRRVTQKETATDTEKEFWVRGGGDLAINGDRNTITVEGGGKAVITGDNCTVYLKDGATLDVQGGRGNRIFHEMDAMIVSAGEEAGLFPSSDITLMYDGSVVSGVKEEMVARGITLAPNPAVTVVRIESVESITGVTLLDVTGRVIREERAEGMVHDLSVEGLPQGTYFVKLATAKGMAVKQLVVR